MADDLPPGYTLREASPAPPVPSGLPEGYTLRQTDEEASKARENEIRKEKLDALMAAGGNRGYTNRLMDAWTSGLSRPMGGALSVIGGEIVEYFGGKPATVGERWRGGVGAEEDYAKAMEKKSEGVLGTATSALGSLASGGKNTGRVGLAKLMTQAGVQGGVEGAARNAEDPGSALAGGVGGAAVSAGTAGVVGALANRLGRVGAAERTIGEAGRGGTSQSLQTEGGEIFKNLDNAGIHFGRTETPDLANKVHTAVAGADTRPIDPVLKIMNDKVNRGAMTFNDVRDIQSKLAAIKASNDPVTRKTAGAAADAVDDFLSSATASVPPGGAAGNWKADLDKARDLWRRGAQAGKIEGLEDVAKRAADPHAATQQEFKSYTDRFLRNPNKYNPNTPEQMRIMDEIVRGSPGKEKLAGGLDTLSKWAAPAGVLGSLGGLVLPHTAVPSAGALALAGGSKAISMTLRQQLARQTAAKVDDLLRSIATGSTSQQGAYVPRAALATLLAKQDAARGVGKIASSNVYDRTQPERLRVIRDAK